MDKSVWIMKDKTGNEVWSTYERDYLTVVSKALESMGLELVRNDLEICLCCGLCNGLCQCQRCETCG